MGHERAAEIEPKYRGAHWKFWKEPLRGAKILFCGRGLNFFFPRGTISQTTHNLLSYFSWFNTLKVLGTWGSGLPYGTDGRFSSEILNLITKGNHLGMALAFCDP